MQIRQTTEFHFPLPSGNYLVIRLPIEEGNEKDVKFVKEFCELAHYQLSLLGKEIAQKMEKSK